MDTLTLFSKNLNQRSLTPRWPLTPCLLRSYVWLYPRIIVSKSHDNTSMYVDTVINFAKYHIHIGLLHTTYILRTYYVQNEWSHSLLLNSVQARQKMWCAMTLGIQTWQNPQATHFKLATLSRVWWHHFSHNLELFISTTKGVLHFKEGQRTFKKYMLWGHMNTTFWTFPIYLYVFLKWSKGQTTL